ncbi:MAG: GNAT family N-acetyltransferase [Armatimonadetes bacterium]|nr:GNAT family N-acetyltransferase [Armatimonadota bacterium]
MRYRINIEFGYIEGSSYSDEMETDAYDSISIHLAAYEDANLIGTMRIIPDSQLGFPMEKEFEIVVPPDYIRKARFCEISRLNMDSSGDPMHRATLGLIKTAKDICLHRNISLCYFAVDSRVWRMFVRLRFGLVQMGHIKMYMGSPCIPAFVNVTSWLEHLENTGHRLAPFLSSSLTQGIAGFEWYNRMEA